MPETVTTTVVRARTLTAMRRTSHDHLHEPSDTFIFGAVFGDDDEVTGTAAVDDETATDWIASAASVVKSGGSLSDAAHSASFHNRHGRAPEEGEHEWDSILGVGDAMMVETDEEDEEEDEECAEMLTASEGEPQEEDEDVGPPRDSVLSFLLRDPKKELDAILSPEGLALEAAALEAATLEAASAAAASEAAASAAAEAAGRFRQRD